MLSRFRKGDTIVEVLFAITVFSLIAVSALSIMNQGLSTSQRSVELTAVRQQVDGQAEALRFLHGAYVEGYAPGITYAPATPAGQYAAILGKTITQASDFSVASCPTAAALSSREPFIVNPYTARVEQKGTMKLTEASRDAKLVFSNSPSGPVFVRSDGLWVEAVSSSAASSGGIGFTDFHIRACWAGPGQSAPMKVGTIVRLYDPR